MTAILLDNLVKNVSTTTGGLVSIPLTSSWASLKTRYRGLSGAAYQTNGLNNAHDRYGDPDKGVSGALLLQATDWTKKVRITSTVGSAIYEQQEKYLRIYREISNGVYLKPGGARTIQPPYENGYPDDRRGSGSAGYPSASYGYGQGYEQIWWILWTGSENQYGALIDYFVTGNDAGDSNLIYGSPRTNGIEYFQNGVSAWDSTYGLSFLEKDGMEYFIIDAGIKPEKNTQVLTSKPTVIRAASTAQGATSIRYVKDRPSPVPGTSVPGLSVSSTQSIAYVWSNLDYNDAGVWKPIALLSDAHQDITTLLENNAPPSQPTKLGSTTISFGTNAIPNNINFSNAIKTASRKMWVGKQQTFTSTKVFIYPVVVDGQDIYTAEPFVPNTGTYASGYDDKWITGHIDPRDYWYVLPRVRRNNSSGCCNNNTNNAPYVWTTAAQAVADFVDQSVNNCTRGAHFGKFLKSAFPSSGDVIVWANFIEACGKRSSNGVVNETLFTGKYISGYTGRADFARPTFSEVAFSLAGLPEFAQASANIAPAATNAGVTAPAVTVDTINTTYLQKLNATFSKTAINSWTAQSVIAYANSQATEIGVPLSDLKAELLQLFLNAKVTWLMTDKSKSQSAALTEAGNDPVYKALAGAFTGTSAVPTTGGGIGSTGTTGGRSGSTNTSPGTTTSGGTSSNAGGSKPSAIAITITRGLPGYVPINRQSATRNDKPMLIQQYQGLSLKPDGSGETEYKTITNEFEFPFVPREVTYSGIGAQWTEIERTGNYPLVDWQSFQLLKISFSFDIVDRKLENTTGFGLYWSCEQQINDLRRMAQAPYPVTFLNMDQFMSEEIRYPLFARGRGIEFVIAELSFTAVQRTPTKAPDIAGEIVANQISRATAQMTLQEIPIENINIVQMPPIKPCKKKCTDTPGVPPEITRSYNLFTPSVIKG